MNPSDMQVPGDHLGPAILKTRCLTLTWPESIRLGDAQQVRLEFQTGGRDGHKSPCPEGRLSNASGRTALPDLYQSHRVLALARLEIPGWQVTPAEGIEQSVLPGEALSFTWKLKPVESGIRDGTAWFALRFFPVGTGDAEERAISAQPVEIQAGEFLGLSGPAGRVLGGFGIGVGVMAWLVGIRAVDGKKKEVCDAGGRNVGLGAGADEHISGR